jgi:hypothetical protein
MLLKVTVVNFNVPGVIFDFDSFTFHVPICGSAAKHAVVASTKKTGVSTIVLIFIRPIEAGFRCAVNIFPS